MQNRQVSGNIHVGPDYSVNIDLTPELSRKIFHLQLEKSLETLILLRGRLPNVKSIIYKILSGFRFGKVPTVTIPNPTHFLHIRQKKEVQTF